MGYVDELSRRIDAIELRIIALAIATGHPELAIPFPTSAHFAERLTTKRFDEAMDGLGELILTTMRRQDAQAEILREIRSKLSNDRT